MKTSIKFTGMDSSDVLRAYAESKFASFDKLISDYDFEAAICDIELRRDTHHLHGDVCTAEVTLEVHGTIYRTSKDEPTMEKSIDKVKDDMLAQLRADKGKSSDFFRKGAREAKEMLLTDE